LRDTYQEDHDRREPANIAIVSAKATYLVGDKVPFRLHNRDEVMPSLEGLDATAFAWNSSPREIVSIDQNGLGVMLKEGKAEITAADKKSPAIARTEVTVKARPER
jgi:hypothetical protein